MPFITTLEENGIYWKCSGIITLSDFNIIHNSLHSKDNIDQIKYFIWDGIDVEHVNLTSIAEIDIPAAMDSAASASYKKHLKAAIVINNDKNIHAIANRYIETSKKLGSSWNFKIFSTVNDAREWVNH